MPISVSPLAAQISSDRRCGLSYFTLSQGTSIASAEARSWSCSTSELPNSRTESPATSRYSSRTSDTGSSPDTSLDQGVGKILLPLVVKDSKLQLHYIHMQKALRTCHPAALLAETSNLMPDLMAEPDDVASSMRRVAETLTKAGCSKIEYTRSCALIAHAIFCQVRSVSLEEAGLFGNSLVGAVNGLFNEYNESKTTSSWHLGGLNGLTVDKEEKINVAAFAGDLFALGLLPFSVVHDHIIEKLDHAYLVSTVHCRKLYMFLLHAKAHIGPSIGLDALDKIHTRLIQCMYMCPMNHDRMAMLWAIECCGVIEQTVEQDRITQRGGKPPVVVYEWLEGLSKGDWFSALILSKKSGDGDQAVATSIDGIDTTTASANPDITSVL